MSAAPEMFKAWASMTAEEGKELKVVPYEYKPKVWTEEDITIEVEETSICGSCLHTMTSGWGPSKYPCVVGHEIVGKVIEAGKNSGHEVGSRVGFGAQCGRLCDGSCDFCKEGQEQYCTAGMVGTYQGAWPEDKGENRHQKGGYGLHYRARGHFAIKIPDSVPSHEAAPMMCGGVTVWTPLKRWNAGPGKKVGVVGVGGLGHFALLFSSALGAETYALSHSDSKKADCEKIGVKPGNFIVTHDAKSMAKEHKAKFDLLIVTSNQREPPVTEYLTMLRPKGTCVFVGLSEEALPRIGPAAIIMNGVSLAGSKIGSPDEIREMLAFVQEKKLHPIIERHDLADINKCLKKMQDGGARYRICMRTSNSGL